MELRDFLEARIPGAPRRLLPARAKRIGGVALLRLRPELEELGRELAEAVKEFYRVRAVYLIRGVEGVERMPRLELLAGEPVTEIVHREYGCVYKLDLTRLMFCLGNSFERMRIAGLTSRGEVVVDMFAGVGQFTIPIAVLGEPEKVYAIEINPVAHRYLLENAGLNGVEDRVEALLGDCREVASERLAGAADRVVMGYFGGTIEALPAALSTLKPEGGLIHFHELARRGGEEDLISKIMRNAIKCGFQVRLISWRTVKSYSRTKNHVVVDFLAAKE
ncbi:MAG: class I SAM-dependent methyltransferase family protein [Nitrososphaeria archaeon]|nr:class I SAM-dependent methyltransferase family protein [Aigarchaeota archaeon]MCX8187803.1 class I SAM-dependent methyltransferase family protein [Nitrososphaeria archaeon]